MKLEPFWWDIDQVLAPTSPAGDMPTNVDFVIVGGGFTGLSAALTIARQGRSVAVLDRGQPGFGASTRNGGICSGNIRPSHSALSNTHGPTFANDVYAEGITARLDLAKFCAEEKIDCQLQMTGRFTGAMSQSDYDQQAREVDRLNKIDGHVAYMVPKSEQQSEITTDFFFGGMLREEIGGFHPGKFFAGLLAKAQAAGVMIYGHTIVHDIVDLTASKKSVTTKKGAITAGKVIVATNAYTGTKEPFGQFLRRRLVPVQSCIIVTERLGQPKIEALMPKLRMYGNTANLYSYFRPTPDRDRLLLGSRSFDKLTPTDRSVSYLKQRVTDIFPSLAHCKIDYCWLGNVAFTRSNLPVIFEKNSVLYAAGYAGSGTVWARWMGKKVAEAALGVSNRPSAFSRPPPASIPFYDGSPWFMPLANKYFALKDWLKR
jgi:glycine/D-amino acid oxidase-like deaminating enzyme